MCSLEDEWESGWGALPGRGGVAGACVRLTVVQRLAAVLAAHPRVRVLVLNDPNNPTGVKMSRHELTALGELLHKPQFRHIGTAPLLLTILMM